MKYFSKIPSQDPPHVCRGWAGKREILRRKGGRRAEFNVLIVWVCAYLQYQFESIATKQEQRNLISARRLNTDSNVKVTSRNKWRFPELRP